MFEEILEFFQQNEWSISILITIIGLFITSKNLTKSFKNEIKKTKQEISINAMQDIPFELHAFMDRLSDGVKHNKDLSKNSKTIKEFRRIFSKILCYGSADLVKTASYSQRNNYKPYPDSMEWTGLVLLSLMIVQMKYDLTGTIISPESYFILTITDYEEKMRMGVKNEINRLVRKLNLNKGFLVDSK